MCVLPVGTTLTANRYGIVSAKIEWVYVSQKHIFEARGHNYGEVILSVQIKLIFRHVRD